MTIEAIRSALKDSEVELILPSHFTPKERNEAGIRLYGLQWSQLSDHQKKETLQYLKKGKPK